ncbi:hypothetical protein GGI35DRAFT_85223 [Trichoderma velutinum]
MQFKSLNLLAAVLWFNHAEATLTAKEIANSLSNITVLSTDTLDVVKGLNLENVDADGLEALKDLRQIVTDAANETAIITSRASNSSAPFDKNDQKNICETFTSFVKAQQDLLQTLVSQKDLLSPIPLSMPLAAVLRFLETGVDKLSFQVIQLVPTCADESKKEVKGLDKDFIETLKAYPIKLHLPGVIGTPLEAPFGFLLEDQESAV